jgi:hypothetical protein
MSESCNLIARRIDTPRALLRDRGIAPLAPMLR